MNQIIVIIRKMGYVNKNAFFDCSNFTKQIFFVDFSIKHVSLTKIRHINVVTLSRSVLREKMSIKRQKQNLNSLVNSNISL